jgi:RNA polymerase sigma-70 factor (ECF subfamily)
MSSQAGSSDSAITRLKRGDESALAPLFAAHRERLRRLVQFRLDRRLQRRLDASDVLQEAYLDARQRLRSFVDDSRMSLFVWLRCVTIQRLIDTHRRHLGAKMRDVRHELTINQHDFSATTSASMAAQLAGRLATPSQMAVQAELRQQLEEALKSMQPIDREILALRHFEELTNSEIAEVLAISPAAASNRYVRALARLRDILSRLPGFACETDLP